MEAARADMQISAELIDRAVAIVAERGAELLGFYVLSVETEGPTLRDLWVEPAAAGMGVGALLWKHMLASARSEGFRTVRIVSDPNAAGFYRRMGARAVGEVASCAIPGRMLPAFEIDVLEGG
jgi:predicted N-acetyltransferase YhbS